MSLIFVRAAAALLLTLSTATAQPEARDVETLAAGAPRLLTDPFLQMPQADGVSVVWMTNFEGTAHRVELEGPARAGDATSVRLSRLFAGPSSKIADPPNRMMRRQVWRHEVPVRGLAGQSRLSYRVVSTDAEGRDHAAGPFTLAPAPAPGAPMTILLTSDMQERYATLANYEAVAAMHPRLDAVFFAGDLVNHPLDASEWFDNHAPAWHADPASSRPAFFPAMQGRFDAFVPEVAFAGGEILQHAPIFPAIANHEVSGRFRPNARVAVHGEPVVQHIEEIYESAQPRWFAEWRYGRAAARINPLGDPEIRARWIRDNSHEHLSYEEIFTLPDDGPEGESYYATRFGEVFLVAMNVSRIWRRWEIGPDDMGKFVEHAAAANDPSEWGFGEFIFTPFHAGTPQYRWLAEALASEEAQDARYRVVMFHQTAHGLGDNAMPVLTDPVMTLDLARADGTVETRTVTMPADPAARADAFGREVAPHLGRIAAVRYDYPLEQDHFHRDIEPLLHAHDVQLLLDGHSHIWNRARTRGLNFLETSNVGNCFGAYWSQGGAPFDGAIRAQRAEGFWAELEKGPGRARWRAENYPATGDPHGRQPIYPTVFNPMADLGIADEDTPFVCSNELSTFSILDTGRGEVRSYVIDLREADSEPRLFDSFALD